MNAIVSFIIFLTVFIFILTFGAWFTHIVYSLIENLWGILLVGILFFPIGIIHGWVIWLGLA